MISKPLVGVLRGGPSSEYDVSLKTGGSILRNMPDKYRPVDILISKDSKWHMEGVEKKPAQILRYFEVIFNGLHGEFGEDGKIQSLLDSFAVPYTGSKSFPSFIGMNKILSKQYFSKAGMKVPYHKAVRREDFSHSNVYKIAWDLDFPLVVKPVSSGSSFGVSIVENIGSLDKALSDILKFSSQAMVEEYIQGREATCGVIDAHYINKTHALPPIEIIPAGSNFFDYEAKYSGESQEICPGDFTKREIEEMQELAIRAHKTLGLRHYSRTDFIISPHKGIYVLETNSLPGLTEESLLPKSLRAVNVEFSEFLDHTIKLALKDK